MQLPRAELCQVHDQRDCRVVLCARKPCDFDDESGVRKLSQRCVLHDSGCNTVFSEAPAEPQDALNRIDMKKLSYTSSMLLQRTRAARQTPYRANTTS